mmetsp:Transcript_15272/g.58075  ORF Transcript_15272/g.58075 Transcript_15272/m.58075 type:complete len:218 (+) Transcript_15272:4165-4818(+)
MHRLPRGNVPKAILLGKRQFVGENLCKLRRREIPGGGDALRAGVPPMPAERILREGRCSSGPLQHWNVPAALGAGCPRREERRRRAALRRAGLCGMQDRDAVPQKGPAFGERGPGQGLLPSGPHVRRGPELSQQGCLHRRERNGRCLVRRWARGTVLQRLRVRLFQDSHGRVPRVPQPRCDSLARGRVLRVSGRSALCLPEPCVQTRQCGLLGGGPA